jgi:hypothetical protein
LAAILLQILLRLTIVVEHHVGAYFNSRPGAFMKFMRYFAAWVVLFASKFVYLEVIVFVFGDKVRFEGMRHGVVPLIIVVVTMVVAEEAIVRLVRWAR